MLEAVGHPVTRSSGSDSDPSGWGSLRPAMERTDETKRFGHCEASVRLEEKS